MRGNVWPWPLKTRQAKRDFRPSHWQHRNFIPCLVDRGEVGAADFLPPESKRTTSLNMSERLACIAVGGGRGLQPAPGGSLQRGTACRYQHRHHPRDGRHRLGRDLSRLGVRVHHDASVVSELVVVAQMGTTIGLGLLFDTLVIRAFMTPSIAALMGKWFWWPQMVRQRPASSRAFVKR
jgi:hypothetical protein